jgi:hypothetical protein
MVHSIRVVFIGELYYLKVHYMVVGGYALRKEPGPDYENKRIDLKDITIKPKE